MRSLLFLSIVAVLAAAPRDATERGGQKPARPASPYTTTLTLAEMTGKQAIITTSAGVLVVGLRPDVAPNHVGYFIKLAREGAFNGTIFHRVIRLAIIQGGDPLSKDPAKVKLYGTGGLGVLAPEFNAERATSGAVAAVLQPNRPDSAGAQFFVCVTDQPAIDGKYTVFGRVAEGMDVVRKISEAAASPEGVPAERIVIESVTIRDTPPPEPDPFSTETPQELGRYRAVLDTSVGPITIEFLPDLAPEHVRNFLRLSQSGVFDGTAFHRVVRSFVVQGGAMNTRGPLSEKQQKYVRRLQPEFSDTKHVKGIISMARGDEPASAMTSFFIVTGDASSLDGKYTVFGRVVDGMTAVDAMDQTAVNGEAPVTRIELKGVKIVH
jgi:peptidyl-prolyl cis-trans isomerase B (cyclophilin B)